MKLRLSAVFTAAAAIVAAAVTLTSTDSFAAPLAAGAAAAGTSTLAPTSGTQATSFTLTPPAGAACPGDSATGGYRWTTFIASRGVDLAVLAHNASGPISPGGSAFVAPLFNTAGTPQTSRLTAVTTGVITPLPTFNFATNVPVPDGQYNIGYACTLSGLTERYWSTPITISSSTATTLSYTFGWAPDAPVLASPLTAGDGTLAGTFTQAAATPALSGFTVTAVPTSGTTVTSSLASGATSFTLTGLTNGTQYAVSIVATNSVGNSAASNSVNGTPNPLPYGAAVITSAVPGSAPGSCDVTWSAPAGDTGRTGYSLVVTASSTPIAGSPFSQASGATSTTVSGLTAGTSYSFQITATYSAPYSGTASNTVTCTPLAAQIISQDITVVRPTGALVLTQRCGVFGALAAEAASAAFPVALSALTASTDQVGTAPTYNGSPDPAFGSYPSPTTANYPTTCGVDLGTASLITSGALSGSYFTASGRMPQITVANTSDTDPGWSITASMGNFTKVGGGSFSGNHLGWTPVVSSDSAATLGGYDMAVTAGASVDPATASSLGASPSKTLASASAGAGLGIAKIDARLKLLVPVNAASGTYTGTLTFTVI